jgi:carbon-monoxide dehydrogenase small subunit
MTKQKVELKINGATHELYAEPKELLLSVIREKIGLMGTKCGCGIGECGACTILVDGKPMLACLILAIAASGKEIVTIEGIADGKILHPIQQAYVDHGAIQCGFCTPGMVIMGKSLLDENPNADEKDIKEFIRGNICRCTGYIDILKALNSLTKGAGKPQEDSISKSS